MNIIKHLFNNICPIPLSFWYTHVWLQHTYTSSEWSCTCYCQSGKVRTYFVNYWSHPDFELRQERNYVWLDRPCCPKCKMKYSPCTAQLGRRGCAQLGRRVCVCVLIEHAWKLSCSWWHKARCTWAVHGRVPSDAVNFGELQHRTYVDTCAMGYVEAVVHVPCESCSIVCCMAL